MQLLNAPFYACSQVLQNIYKTKRFDWPGRGETPADIEVGGDQPWIRRMVGISTCPQVASLFNEAVRKDGEWVGAHIRRTLDRAREHWENFFIHKWANLSCAGYSTEAILLVEVTHICLCILHLCMAMGRLLAEFTQRAAKACRREGHRARRAFEAQNRVVTHGLHSRRWRGDPPAVCSVG